MIYTIDKLAEINIDCKKWDKIYFYWDLWAGKTTLIKQLIGRLLWKETIITSPTYIHYKKYEKNIYHFDLYRLSEYEEFINIWWEEILDNEDNICFIEWPEIIENTYKPSVKIFLKKVDWKDDERDIIIEHI